MRLVDALRTSQLSHGTVVAGQAMLDNEVTWVHVIDHPDIESWTRPGQLLLTTGYHWPKTDQAASNLVKALHARGLSGVVLAVPKFLDHFPGSSIQAAEELGLPLIEIPWEVPFSDITYSLHCNILDQQAQAIARAQEIHSELTRAALEGSGLQDLASTVGRLLGRTISFCDFDRRILGSYRHSGNGDAEIHPSKSIAAAFGDLGVKGLKAVLSAGRAARLARRGGDPGCAVCPITVRGETVGIAWVLETGTPLGELDLRALEHASTVAALLLSHQKEISEQEAKLGYTFVDSLLEGRFEPTPTSLERAAVLRWDPEKPYRVCLILINEPLPLSREGLLRREEWTERLKAFLHAAGMPALLSVSLNQIRCLLPEEFPASDLWSGIGSKTAAMAVSRPHSGVSGMAKGAHDVQGLVATLKPGRLHHFDEILFPRVLEGDREAQHEFVDGIFGKLSGNRRAELSIETLLLLAEEGFQLVSTARKLDIHISTLRYRVQRLQEVLDLSIEDAETRFRLQVAARLYKMREGL